MSRKPRKTNSVLLSIEREDSNKFRVQSDQLEAIGAKLRGPRRFSVFNSIVLPVIVSVVTVLASTSLQWISWYNSVRLQNATEIAARATQTYEKAAVTVGKRINATTVFIPSVRDFILAKANANKEAASAKENAGKVKGFDLAAAGNLPPAPGVTDDDHEPALNKLVHELKKRRYDAYYEHLKLWNESYDQSLTDIDYALDRPIMLQAEIATEGVQVFNDKFKNINCAHSLTRQFDELKLNKHSLKLQFAGIHHCFVKINRTLDESVTQAVSAALPRFDRRAEAAAHLGDIRTMANEFRCYALRRIDYYNRQKERSIISIPFLWRWITKAHKKDANEHFETTAERCRPEKRSV